ncbi:glutamate synthase large subunit [Puniceicoccus vermicola]|uniref:Glutamate synthase [NADPH] large chain n=1 Tax=Puniceicoccus vermicola TaxID=388746 RepID=A0A7X1AY09_9BACT|nr:glutamate synthase large subunit [Puniceicoccus vermicola]MBC2602095.1 glutamate synthase large subunit [Puniceicoccus vermicola]
MTFDNPSPLYNPDQEHDACGVGFIANINGERSYATLDRALQGLKNLAHRGAIDADAVTGDGAGVLTQIPYELFESFLEEKGKTLYEKSDLGVGMVFMPRDDEYARNHAKQIIEDAIKKEGLNFLAWRDVPVNPECLGKKAELTRPAIVQVLIGKAPEMDGDAYERALFLAMRTAMREAGEKNIPDFYIVSFSHRTITYKGLLNAPQVGQFYTDLRSELYQTAFTVFHQRFATNTLPDWTKAQPYRMLAHNGEINTIKGNRNLMRAREFSNNHGVWGDRYKDLSPMIQQDMSDSTSLDNTLQLLSVGGRTCFHGVSMMIPSAWENNPNLPEDVRAFYRCHSAMMEPWDGPAAVAFTDGRFVGGTLDRNGLRPCRYKIYEDGFIVLGSEAGLIRDWGSPVIEAGRLGPGRMIAVDIEKHTVLRDADIKNVLAGDEDYVSWCKRSLVPLSDLIAKKKKREVEPIDEKEITPLRVCFGYSTDEEEMVLKPLVQTGQEAVASMGDDTPLAVFSQRSRLLFSYFRQLFAQVTNPAIDSLRERSVMSVKVNLGGRLGLFEPLSSEHPFITLESPLLFESELKAIRESKVFKGTDTVIDTTFPADIDSEKFGEEVKRLVSEAVDAVEGGAKLILLSDRKTSAKRAPIPALLAVGAVHQGLVRAGRRLRCDIIADTAEARDVHQIACLLGFGANAVHPWFAQDMLIKMGAADEEKPLDAEAALANYRKAIDKGILKIMSKMGISTLFSYQGAQVFEAVGISYPVIRECFRGSACPIGGIGYPQICDETLARHQKAYGKEPAELWDEGYYSVVKRGAAEFHGWNSKVVGGMNKIFRGDSKKFDRFLPFKEASENHQSMSVRDLLKFRYLTKPISLENVEPIDEIRRRFTTAGMSLGAISPETHEALAIAMNSIGGKSNSGEGGEDPKRFRIRPDGTSANSAIKQVASGRFGVTAAYLANAREIEIKVAQGAKPGEGGQLPGHKVTDLIATLRFSVPGVTLISPPPHHDIYSIEDLAQLIYDLKQVNPRAKVCVKLVSSSGVGTIAAGVAKAYADVILISGHDGGTGASPISSIKHAGSAWEIGLAEAHQVLMMNDLRSRVVLRTDGGMKTGRDIVIAAILGAEEFNFGTGALIAAGCAMFRVCHKNTCPVGVATQREDLRKKFKGKPENLINYFNAVAEDVRRIMANLGVATIDELVGRTDLLEQIQDPKNPKTATINFAGILHNPDPSGVLSRIHTRERNDRIGGEGSIDDQILQEAIETVTHLTPKFSQTYKVKNVHRNIGTHLSGEIAYMHGNNGMPAGTMDLKFIGSAGQSFGTFLVQGVRLTLMGEANDYVGKGMNGGEIIVRPQDRESFVWKDNIIVGNTCLYGSTGGFLFAAGLAGERFAVRNSGGTAVVEGIGDHGCEYMTGGTVVVLGETGTNFGAGMSGGLAFIYDPDKKFEQSYNPEMVTPARLDKNDEITALKKLIELHASLTESPHAKALLKKWKTTVSHFWKVVPHRAEGLPEPVFEFGEKLEAVIAKA